MSHRAKRRLLEAVVIVLAVFDVRIWYAIATDDSPLPAAQANINVPVRPKTPYGAPGTPLPAVGTPVLLMIPSIAVNAVVEKTALTAQGSMGVPKVPRDAAWYALGPRPGETGNAVIAGHVDWLYGATAVFADLRKLKPGDRIAVQDDKGAIVTFAVRGSKSYAPSADATDVFFSADGKTHLVLVTCGGTWDKQAKQYTKRLVVFADKVAE